VVTAEVKANSPKAAVKDLANMRRTPGISE
jgi:hypothetical protein